MIRVERRVLELRAKSSDYCFVAVVWNEGERIRKQIERMGELRDHADLVIVDGGSDDGSLDHEHLCSNGFTALVVTSQRGLSTATRVAISYALEHKYSGLITVDGNGKDGVEALPEFIAKLEDGYGLVQGSRFTVGGSHRNTPLARLIGVRGIVSPLVSMASGQRYTDPTNAFRAISREYLLDPKLQPLRDVFVRFNLQLYLIYRAPLLGYRVGEIPVSRVYPSDGSVPTKIVSWRTKVLFLWELAMTLLGRYDPRA